VVIKVFDRVINDFQSMSRRSQFIENGHRVCPDDSGTATPLRVQPRQIKAEPQIIATSEGNMGGVDMARGGVHQRLACPTDDPKIR